MAKIPEVGAAAPEFTLPFVELRSGEAVRGELSLASARGRAVVLVFYPGDETPVCTRQLCAYTSELTEFTTLDAVVWAISPQGLDSHERFARKHGLGLPLLADVDLTVVGAYGIGMPGLGLRRSVFVVDADGIVRWKHVTLVGLTYPSAASIGAQVRALAG
jgi:peroxiredoxin Q/BCP